MVAVRRETKRIADTIFMEMQREGKERVLDRLKQAGRTPSLAYKKRSIPIGAAS
jgi:hypothetical protein